MRTCLPSQAAAGGTPGRSQPVAGCSCGRRGGDLEGWLSERGAWSRSGEMRRRDADRDAESGGRLTRAWRWLQSSGFDDDHTRYGPAQEGQRKECGRPPAAAVLAPAMTMTASRPPASPARGRIVHLGPPSPALQAMSGQARPVVTAPTSLVQAVPRWPSRTSLVSSPSSPTCSGWRPSTCRPTTPRSAGRGGGARLGCHRPSGLRRRARACRHDVMPGAGRRQYGALWRAMRSSRHAGWSIPMVRCVSGPGAHGSSRSSIPTATP